MMNLNRLMREDFDLDSHYNQKVCEITDECLQPLKNALKSVNDGNSNKNIVVTESLVQEVDSHTATVIWQLVGRIVELENAINEIKSSVKRMDNILSDINYTA